MTRASRIAFERVDPDDPSLAVDSLRDLFPGEVDPKGDQLAIGWLDDLFAAASELGAAARRSPAALDAELTVNDLADYFPADDKVCDFAIGDDVWER